MLGGPTKLPRSSAFGFYLTFCLILTSHMTCTVFYATILHDQTAAKRASCLPHVCLKGKNVNLKLAGDFSKQIIQLLLLRDVQEVSSESGVSVSRLVSWHFCGLGRQPYVPWYVGFGCLQDQILRTFIVHTTSRHQVNPVASVSPCVPTSPCL